MVIRVGNWDAKYFRETYAVALGTDQSWKPSQPFPLSPCMERILRSLMLRLRKWQPMMFPSLKISNLKI